MNKRQKDIFLLAALILFFLVIFVTGIVYLNYAIPHKKVMGAKVAVESEDELVALLDRKIAATPREEPAAEEEPVLEKEEVSDSGTKPEALTDQKVKLKDVYSMKGEDISFWCFDPEAEDYVWEYYDTEAGEWRISSGSSVSRHFDELGRKVSEFQIKEGEAKDNLLVRCTLKFSGKEEEIQTASLHLIEKIERIAVEDFETEANRYLGANELPVTVFYEDGGEEELTGLANVYFITTEEDTDYGSSVSGNRIETTTIIRTECEYYNTGLESREVLVRYRADDQELEATCSITGRDARPPEIKEVMTSPFEISGIDQPVDMTIVITAEDDATPYPELEYAFLYYDQEPIEADWQKKPSFDVSIERNGIYLAYVRDQAGNVTKLEKEIITVDTKAPAISAVSLSDEGWCQCCTILVTAKDAGEISYNFENKAAGISSGWITYHEYTADTNGIWTIKARDVAGNLAETEITISNIDKEAPVIKKISAK